MYNTKKEQLCSQALRALRHQVMQPMTRDAAQLLQEQCSMMEEDIFWGCHCGSPQKAFQRPPQAPASKPMLCQKHMFCIPVQVCLYFIGPLRRHCVYVRTINGP